MKYTATCLFGLEGLLGREIDALGYKRCETIDGRVTFEGDESAAPRANINLRFAERVYINMGTFPCTTFDSLFEGTCSLPWEEFISKDDAFPVSGHCIKSKLFSVPNCQKIVKKAVARRLGGKYGLETLPETQTVYKIEFFIFKDSASLMIDTSGTALHKRGYRPETVSAPLRETLAAALASLARPRENVLFCDPFCGSGTIAIEAAMIMKNIAPGINRSFAAELFPAFSEKLWREAREEARANEVSTDFRASAGDIDPECVRIAEEAARRAGVSDTVSVRCADALKLTSDGVRGTIVTNPPYGERLMTPEAVRGLYADMGKCFRSLEPWQIYVLTPAEDFERLYGRRADKIRKLYNGMIPCLFYQFFKPQSKAHR